MSEQEHERFKACVMAFLNERPEYMAATREANERGDDIRFYRAWGQAEARRMLAERLGLPVPVGVGR